MTVSIVLFTTSTCQYCAPVKKALEELAEKYGDDMSLRVWTLDKNPKAMQTAKEWRIKGVPAIIILINGEEIGTIVGQHTKERLDELIQGCIQSYVFQKSPPRGDETGSSVLRDTGESEDRPQRSDQNRNRAGVEL